MLVDFWLLIDPGLESRMLNELAKLGRSTLYWVVVVTVMAFVVARVV